jgi:hypothetical protein
MRSQPLPRVSTASRVLRAGLLTSFAGLLLTACNSGGGGGGGGQSGIVGTEVAVPGSARTFFIDPNESGGTTDLMIAELFWARLVDVHDIDLAGNTNPSPVFRDFTISPDILSDGVDYRLERNPVTQRDKLVILRQKGTPDFRPLLDAATTGLTPIATKDDDGTSPGPFSVLARNACLVVRFNDCLDNNPDAVAALPNHVKLLTGYAPTVPFDARVVFDPNYGALLGSDFRPTRVIVDLTVSQAEANAMAAPLPVNSLGLPASLVKIDDPNVSLRIPTEVAVGLGQFSVLRGIGGRPLSTKDNGPMDETVETFDIVRAMRSGNSDDGNNGFLRDQTRPEILGSWPVNSLAVAQDLAGDLGFDFILTVGFTTPCQDLLDVGDTIEVGTSFLEVTEQSAAPDGGGVVTDLKVRAVTETPIFDLASLMGSGNFLSTFDVNSTVDIGCWLTITPAANVIPTTEISTTSVIGVRFTEAMDPAATTALDSLMVIRGAAAVEPDAENIVVGLAQPGPDLDRFQYTPVLPFDHTQGTSETFHLEFGRKPKDLAGNDVVTGLPDIEFTIDPLDPTSENGGIVMRLNDFDEVGTIGTSSDPIFDLRGQILYDTARGSIRPRDVQFASHIADRTQAVPAAMSAVAGGVFDPLSPLGSKVQTLWRHCDLGWVVDDETKMNLDVIGLNWAPIGGNVISDFFEGFSIRLSHSPRLPDEGSNPASGITFPMSGLFGSPNLYVDNVLSDDMAFQAVVHQRALGYMINPVDLFQAASGTIMMPFPLNRGTGPTLTYTWRDTGIQSFGDDDIKKGVPLWTEANNAFDNQGRVIKATQPIPTFCLPLLMEYRCYPSSTGVGLNSLDASLATAAAGPNFRAYSTGGTDATGNGVTKNPDQEFVPSGGFQPITGMPTATDADPTFYIGQLDTVTRVSRAHSIWLDTSVTPEYITPVIEPDQREHPEGTSLVLEFRGALGFTGNFKQNPFNAKKIDPYGELRLNQGNVTYFKSDDSWKRTISDLDGARYLQIRFTFVNNITSRLSVELSALGIAFRNT